MIKRKFGMACLNISQGRFNNYSHKNLNAYDLAGMDSGIDRFRTFNDLTVVGIHEYSKTGFANTICFYDKENDVTLAMTHVNSIPSGCVVGKVYHSGDTIYYEGIKGNATGNHIHLEIGRGKQSSKTKIDNIWQLKNLINIEDYFYIDKDYTEVRNANGYVFDTSSESNDQDKYELKDGLNTFIYKGVEIKAYVQSSNEESTVVKVEGKKTLKQFMAEYPCKACSNLNYFDGYDVLGRCQGENIDGRPDQQQWLDIVQLKDNDNVVKTGDFASWQYTKEEILWGSSFGVGLIVEWSKCDINSYHSTGIEKRILTESNRYTVIGQVWDNRNVILACNGKLTALELQDFASKAGLRNAFLFDGGGSCHVGVNGKEVTTTPEDRALPCFFVIKDKPVEKPVAPSEVDKLKAEVQNLRTELSLQREAYIKEIMELQERNKALEDENNELRELKEDLEDANNSLGKKLKAAYRRIIDLKNQGE